MSVVVAQLGARMHYAVPRILERAGLLERLYTDICASKGWPGLFRMLPGPLRSARIRRLLSRIPCGVPASRITAFTGFGLENVLRFARTRNREDRNAAFLGSGREFCRHVVAKGFGKAKTVYVFNSAGLEVLQEARRRGLKGILEQTIAPRIVEWTSMTDEAIRFPDWEFPVKESRTIEAYCARESAEWAAADLILCGSEFVRDGVIAHGGAQDRCVVIPYGLEGAAMSPTRPPRTGPLRVLTVGAVCLRKGSPYTLEAARRLAGRAEFRMVGAVQILPVAAKKLRSHIHLTGIIPRSEMAAHYDWADVFLLPSLCEGSATATYEAMFRGLPIVCTPQTGSVVRDGIDGFIVPPRNSQALVKKLALLASNPELISTMSENSRLRSSNYTLKKYGERLISCFRERHLI